MVAIRELEAGDVLRRFGPEGARDEPRRSNNGNRCEVVGAVLAVVGELSLHVHGIVFTGVLCFSSFFELVHVSVMICGAFCFDGLVFQTHACC